MRYLSTWLALVVSLSLPAEPAPRERAQVDVFTPQGTVKGVRQIAVRFSEQMVTFGDPRKIHMHRIIRVVPDRMFPKPPLPDSQR